MRVCVRSEMALEGHGRGAGVGRLIGISLGATILLATHKNKLCQCGTVAISLATYAVNLPENFTLDCSNLNAVLSLNHQVGRDRYTQIGAHLNSMKH